MKHIFRYVVVFAAVLFVCWPVQAQVNYKNQNGVSTAKNVTGPNSDGTYTISLETFATGTSTPTKTSTPVDVVLVLDVSGSMEEPKGTATQLSNNTNISYNTIKNSTESYFIRVNLGSTYEPDYHFMKLYPLEYGGAYYLYFDYGSHIASDRIQYFGGVSSPNGTIITTSNNRIVVTAKESRMDALKPAVKTFINNIAFNASHYKDGTARADTAHLKNRISIITFSNDDNTLCGLTLAEGNESTLCDYVDGLKSGGGTYAGSGMDAANSVLSGASDNANKVVVMFTDGVPSDYYDAIGSNDNGGSNAYRAKHSYDASVFTIGLFEKSPKVNDDTWKYLNYVSSNYPNATVSHTYDYWGRMTGGTMSAGSDGDPSGNFYKDASGDVDLTAIFDDISGSIGGSEESIGSSTQIRDMVTSSFTIPSGTASALTVEVWRIDKTSQEWVKESTNPSGITARIGKKKYPDEKDSDGNPVQRDTVGVTGFDFSKDDTTQGAGDGNWVGIRYDSENDNQSYYAGRKLVISFKVKETSGATGGVGSATNTSESGVYVLREDGTYDNVNPYEIPHTTLPVTIKITKTGLRHGESATFQIFKIAPKIDTLTSTTGQRDSVVWRYNAIGKPLPNEHAFKQNKNGDLDPNDPQDYLEGTGWEKWSKVILSNKGADKEKVVKTLVALDPNWVYCVIEDDWSWSYTTTGSGQYQTTSTVEINPFSFSNKEKSGVPKHAEAVTINHFGYTIPSGEFQGKQEEHYKSSKTKL